MSPTTQVSSEHFEWNRQGFFALPEDTETSYRDRVNQLSGQAGDKDLPASRELLQRRYDINPSWVPVEYSNAQLYPWEAGCTWFSDSIEEAPNIQLRSSFAHSPVCLGIYQKDEVLAHEYVHAVRAPLGSSAFEEIFSYLVSFDFASGIFSYAMRAFRVFLGPVFERTLEPMLLLFSLALLLATSVWADSFLFAPILLLGAIMLIFLGRLIYRWRQWGRCFVHLRELTGVNTLALMVRLTDEEIVLFSRLPSSKIHEWIKQQQEHNFRWSLLAQAYIGISSIS